MRLSLLRSSFLAVALLWAGGANAVPIDYAVEVGSEGSFAFSYLHDADSGNGQFYYSGDKLFELTGTISGSFEAATGVLELDTDIVLDALVRAEAAAAPWNLTPGQIWDFNITGGTLTNPPGGDDLFSGSFTYALVDLSNVTQASGTFYFAAVDFPGSPNTLTTEQLAAWGNNWDNTAGSATPPDRGSNGLDRLGVDIRAQGTVIPEPTGFIVFGIGALVAAAGATASRRREVEA
jgi:hypothetical protein